MHSCSVGCKQMKTSHIHGVASIWSSLLTIYTEVFSFFCFTEDIDSNDSGIDESELIYHVNEITNQRRLCIPVSMVKEVFKIAHDSGHPGFNRCFQIVASSWYIRGMSKRFRSYFYHCPQCLMLQTRRHQLYGALQPIESPPVPYHTITLDFILALPTSKGGFNAMLTAASKFSGKDFNIEKIAPENLNERCIWYLEGL